MILESIILENIRSYSYEEIEFPRGITLFEGDIGSGKSTVLMAIEFALFGLGSQKPESLLAKRSNEGHVILDFSMEGRRYVVKRTLKRKTNSITQDAKNSWLQTDNQKEPLSPSELKQRILQILKFNEPVDPKSESRIFRYAIFTPQEAMKEVLSDPKKRLETIRKAFGIEDYNVAASNAQEVAREIREKMAVLQERFKDIAQIESQIKESESIIRKTNAEINEKKAKLQEIDKEKKAMETELKQLQEENQERIKTQTRLDGLQESITAKEKEIAGLEEEIAMSKDEIKKYEEELVKLGDVKRPTLKSIEDIETELIKYQEISEQLIKLNSQKQDTVERIAKTRKDLGNNVNLKMEKLSESLSLVQKDKEGYEEKLEQVNKMLETVQQEKVENETKLSTYNDELYKISKLGTKCHTCLQEISEEHHQKLEGEIKAKIDRINERITKSTDQLFDLKSQASRLESQVKECEDKKREVENIIPLVEEHNQNVAKLAEIEDKIKRLDGQNVVPKEEFECNTTDPVVYLNALKNALYQYENSQIRINYTKENIKKSKLLIEKNQREMDSVMSTIAEKRKESEALKEKIQTYRDLDKKIAEAKGDIDSIYQEVNRVSNSHAALCESLKNEQLRLSENEKRITDAKMWQQQYKTFSEFYYWLSEFFVPTVNQIEKQVLLTILQNFNDTYQRWYSILIEDYTKESRIDENFTPIVNQDGYDQEINYLSGGEKTSIALAYRLTLNSLMRKESESMKSNLLILDEPTDGFSKSQLSKIRSLLQELHSQQIILVSHEKELETYVDNIYHITKENGSSHVSRIAN